MFLLGMRNNNAPGNDRLTKEFFVTFWYKIHYVFKNYIRTAKH